jgi:hypothetical protein
MSVYTLERFKLTAALFEYLEIFHNRNHRHSSIGMLTPVEYERLHGRDRKHRLTLEQRVQATRARTSGPRKRVRS